MNYKTNERGLVDDLEIFGGWLWNTGEASFRRLGWKKPLEQKETKRPNRDSGAVRFKRGLRFATDRWIYWESSFLQSILSIMDTHTRSTMRGRKP